MKNRILLAATLATAALSGAAFADDTTTNHSMMQQSATSQTGAYIGDSALTAKIKTNLLAKKNLSSSGIEVDTTNGVVTLAGTVPSKSQVKMAVMVARNTDGVKDVHNVLTVKDDS